MPWLNSEISQSTHLIEPSRLGVIHSSFRDSGGRTGDDKAAEGIYSILQSSDTAHLEMLAYGYITHGSWV